MSKRAPLVRIATRQSRLALWQAEEVARRLCASHPGLGCELLRVTTRGDRFLDAPLGAIGGKGLFIKELEQALLDGAADIAVHSMKDVTVDLPPGLHIGAVMERASPWDAWVCPAGQGLDTIAAGARIGSSSLRRQSQVRHRRPDLDVRDVRGNVDTRLRKLDAGEFDALLLACAGLERLELGYRITEILAADALVPAIGQGAMAIECRQGDRAIEPLLEALNHPPTAVAVAAERALNRALGGGCHVPIGGHAELEGARLVLAGFVGSVDGRNVLRHRAAGSADAPEALGRQVADALMESGAGAILAAAP